MPSRCRSPGGAGSPAAALALATVEQLSREALTELGHLLGALRREPDDDPARRPAPTLADAVNALYKAELIGRHGPWRTAEQVELATLAWVGWWNQRRPHGAIGNIPPAEHEAIHHREHPQSKEVA